MIKNKNFLEEKSKEIKQLEYQISKYRKLQERERQTFSRSPTKPNETMSTVQEDKAKEQKTKKKDGNEFEELLG